MPPSSTTPPQPDITSPAIQKENNIADYVTHLQVDDIFLNPTDTAPAAQDHEKLSDLARIRNIPATPTSSSLLSPKDMAEMRSFISLISLIRGKQWNEALPFLSNVEDPLKKVVGDLLHYREELAEEDVKKIGGTEIGILRLEGAMAIMEVMRMADEDELKHRKRGLEVVKATKGLRAIEVMDTMAMLQREEGMDDGDLSFQRQLFKGEDATTVLQIDEQAMKEALVNALVDIQHEEERAEIAEAEFGAQLRAQTRRLLEARSGSEERDLSEEIKTTEEAVAQKKDVVNLDSIGRSEQSQFLHRKEPPSAFASNNDLKTSGVRRSLNPMESAKPAKVIGKMKKEKGGEDKVDVKAQIKDEANAVQAAKVGEGSKQKLQVKKRTRSTEDIRFGVKLKKQKV